MSKKKIDKLASLYVILAVFVAVMSVFSFTFAWYVKSNTQYLNIKFAPPIVINVTNDVSMVKPIDGNTDALIPGSKINMQLGIKMDEHSSNAYVRAKMTIVFESVFDENNQLIQWDEFVNVDNAISPNWEPVNFSKDPMKDDIWYVCRTGSGSQMVAREVSPGDEILFANGTIDLSLELDNRFADKEIKIAFVVESIQTVGVSDPLAGGKENARYHEIWGSN